MNLTPNKDFKLDRFMNIIASLAVLSAIATVVALGVKTQ